MIILEARLPLVLTGVLALGVGCVSMAPETARRQAQQTVRMAEALGSDDTPSAADQLRLARAELDRAELLIRRGEMERAGEVLERAKADAELAIALRREDEARSAALWTHEELDQLHDEQSGTDGAALPTGPITAAPSVRTSTEETP